MYVTKKLMQQRVHNDISCQSYHHQSLIEEGVAVRSSNEIRLIHICVGGVWVLNIQRPNILL